METNDAGNGEYETRAKYKTTKKRATNKRSNTTETTTTTIIKTTSFESTEEEEHVVSDTIHISKEEYINLRNFFEQEFQSSDFFAKDSEDYEIHGSIVKYQSMLDSLYRKELYINDEQRKTVSERWLTNPVDGTRVYIPESATTCDIRYKLIIVGLDESHVNTVANDITEYIGQKNQDGQCEAAPNRETVQNTTADDDISSDEQPRAVKISFNTNRNSSIHSSFEDSSSAIFGVEEGMQRAQAPVKSTTKTPGERTNGGDDFDEFGYAPPPCRESELSAMDGGETSDPCTDVTTDKSNVNTITEATEGESCCLVVGKYNMPVSEVKTPLVKTDVANITNLTTELCIESNEKSEIAGTDEKQAMTETTNTNTSDESAVKGNSICTFEDQVEVFIYTADILNIAVDCIVNATNPELHLTTDLGKQIKLRGGLIIEKQCRATEGLPLPATAVQCTDSGTLSHLKAIIHVVCPMWFSYGKFKDDPNIQRNRCFTDLCNAVIHCLEAASKRKYEIIAFTMIGSGFAKIPEDIRMQAYWFSVSRFVKENPKTSIREVHFVAKSTTGNTEITRLHGEFKKPTNLQFIYVDNFSFLKFCNIL